MVWNNFYFSIYIGDNHPNWLFLSEDWNHQPVKVDLAARIGLWSRLPLSDASWCTPSGCVAVASHRNLWRSRCWRNPWTSSFPHQARVVPSSVPPKPRVGSVWQEPMSWCLHQRADRGQSNLGPCPDSSTQGAPRSWLSNHVVPATQGINPVVFKEYRFHVHNTAILFLIIYFTTSFAGESPDVGIEAALASASAQDLVGDRNLDLFFKPNIYMYICIYIYIHTSIYLSICLSI